MDLVRFGSQMFQLFHKQQVPLIVCKHLINSQQTPQVGLPFGGGGRRFGFFFLSSSDERLIRRSETPFPETELCLT